MMFRQTAILTLLLMYLGTNVWSVEPKVYLTVSVERNAPLDAAQSWTRELEKIDFGEVRIRSSKSIEVSVTKSQNGKRYDILGVIDRKNRLLVPGGQFRVNQLSKIKLWHAQVIAGELTRKPADRAAFGLSNKQLVTLFDDLAKPVNFQTRGKSTGDAVVLIRDTLGLQIGVSPAARTKLRPMIDEELQGVACGTALAAMLRPLGLVLVPQINKTEVVIAIADVRESKESWPIGWPPKKKLHDLVPKLFDRLNAQIVDTSMATVLNSIQQNLQVPFLYDRNSLARIGVDLEKTIAKFPARTTFYKKVIDHILTNQLLQAEIRVDEAGKPFVWITSSKR